MHHNVLYASSELAQVQNEILAFWSAYILTRPLGASFADWAGRNQSAGGLGLGTGWVSLVLTIMIVISVGNLTVTHKDSTLVD
jgi:uncharacterized membrane-anchored protein